MIKTVGYFKEGKINKNSGTKMYVFASNGSAKELFELLKADYTHFDKLLKLFEVEYNKRLVKKLKKYTDRINKKR